ncbi:MAG TPA: glycosyltransferase family 39 protein [Candidatus Binatia bacterium]|nr:glycosyltransferase family 39 protein [Candidatus Binatia bacterium]
MKQRASSSGARRVGLGPARLFLVAGVVLLAYALRVNCLDCQSLWLDEASSAYRATIPLVDFFHDTASNLHTPGYFLLLRGWVALGGISAFSLRYFSVLGGLLIIAVAYWAAQRLLRSRTSATLAALFLALSPAHVFYSQETRMYVFLPLVYLLMLVQVRSLARRARLGGWAMLVVLELPALYLHYFSALMLLAVNVLLALVAWRRRSRPSFVASWLVSQSFVALAFAPWLWFTWFGGGALPANLANPSAGEAVFTLPGYFSLVWTFLLTGLIETRAFLGYWSILLAVLLTALILFGWFSATPDSQKRLLDLLLALFIPLLAGALVWWFNPLTHPRYLFFLVAPVGLLEGYAFSILLRRRRLAALAVGAVLLALVLDISALRAAQIDATQRRYDAASLSAAISQRGGSNDLVLMPPNDRSLWYYDPSPVHATNWPFAAGNLDGRPSALGRRVQGYDTAFLVTYEDLYSYDPLGQLPFLLEANGQLLESFSVDRMDVSHYALSGWSTPELVSLDRRCGPMSLTGAYFPSQVAPGDAPAVALQWQLEEATSQALIASARIMDGEEQLSGSDRALLDARGTRTGSWSPGEEAITYFVLPLPQGTPPLSYDLQVMLYAEGRDTLRCGSYGDAIHLGQIALSSADRREADAYGTWSDVLWQHPAASTVSSGLALEGYSIRPRSLLPAQPFYVTLRWRAIQDQPQVQAPVLQLLSEGAVVEEASGGLFRRYPTSMWREGDLFIETRELTMPVTPHPLHLTLAAGDAVIPLRELLIDAGELLWAVPEEAVAACARFEGVGMLRGYNWRVAEDSTGRDLTLYWQASDEAPATTSYTVFAQLLTLDGLVQSQDDGLPAEGERPTTSWLPGEVIADERHFDLSSNDQTGSHLSVGLYDLTTLQRVPAFDCAGRRLPDDALSIAVSASD